MPNNKEPDLQILYKVFDQIIQDIQYTIVQEVVSQAVLFEANCKKVHTEPQKLFDSQMDITTIQSYTQVQKQILYYIIQAENKDIDQQPVYKLISRQQIAIQRVKFIIQEFQEQKQDQSINNSNKDNKSNKKIKFIGRIQQEILQLCIVLLNYLLQDNKYQNVIISRLAVIDIQDDDRQLDTKDYISKYSAIIKLAWLIVVQEGYKQQQEAIQQLQEQGSTTEDVKEEVYSYYYFICQLTY